MSAVWFRSQRGLMVSSVLLVALLMVFSGIRHAYLDLIYTSADTELSFWGREKYQPTANTVGQTMQQLKLLLHHSPHHPDYLARQAYFLSWQGFFSSDVSTRLDFNSSALATQQQAMRHRPAYRQGWIEVVEYASRATGGAQALAEAQARLNDLQPRQR